MTSARRTREREEDVEVLAGIRLSEIEAAAFYPGGLPGDVDREPREPGYFHSIREVDPDRAIHPPVVEHPGLERRLLIAQAEPKLTAVTSCLERSLELIVTFVYRFAHRVPQLVARSAQLRQDLILVETEVPFLLGPYLLHVDLVVAGVGVRLELLQVLLGVGAAGERLSHHVLGDELGGLLEVPRGRQYLGELPGQGFVGPQPVGGLARRVLVLAPAHFGAGVGGFVP